jgi:hypothetical protein
MHVHSAYYIHKSTSDTRRHGTATYLLSGSQGSSILPHHRTCLRSPPCSSTRTFCARNPAIPFPIGLRYRPQENRSKIVDVIH